MPWFTSFPHRTLLFLLFLLPSLSFASTMDAIDSMGTVTSTSADPAPQTQMQARGGMHIKDNSTSYGTGGVSCIDTLALLVELKKHLGSAPFERGDIFLSGSLTSSHRSDSKRLSYKLSRHGVLEANSIEAPSCETLHSIFLFSLLLALRETPKPSPLPLFSCKERCQVKPLELALGIEWIGGFLPNMTPTAKLFLQIRPYEHLPIHLLFGFGYSPSQNLDVPGFDRSFVHGELGAHASLAQFSIFSLGPFASIKAGMIFSHATQDKDDFAALPFLGLKATTYLSPVFTFDSRVSLGYDFKPRSIATPTPEMILGPYNAFRSSPLLPSFSIALGARF